VAPRFLDLRFAIWDIVRAGNRWRGEGNWLVTYDGDWRETFRPDIPSVARIYDWRPDPGDVVPANAAESCYCVVVARTN
jgi:hypothetical protein